MNYIGKDYAARERLATCNHPMATHRIRREYVDGKWITMYANEVVRVDDVSNQEHWHQQVVRIPRWINFE